MFEDNPISSLIELPPKSDDNILGSITLLRLGNISGIAVKHIDIAVVIPFVFSSLCFFVGP